jgi:4-amino-4-deoxy-L-arabinose transferase-like glycosyltransferase
VTAEETIIMATDYAVPTDTPARLLTERRTFPRIAAAPLAWRHAALGAVLLVAAALNLWGLDREGYANTYYAAAVKSMLTSWHNFFYLSFDSGGFVSVDKAPLGLWVQAASAKVFGFSGLSLLVPEALAGVFSVAMLYSLVARVFGAGAGLVAALALALTPVSVVTSRNNTIDSLLVLTLLLGAWAVSRAAETGRLRLLLLGALVVGLGFNVKMLQAYLVVPAFGLMYLLGAPRRRLTRIGHLALALLVLLVVSFAWAVAVDLTPAGARPFVSDSGTNSELSLILGYNGLGRVTQALAGPLGALHLLHLSIDLQIVPAVAPGIGDPGLLRLLSQALGGQASWLLPLAVVGLLVAAARARRRLPLDRRGQALVLWGGWLFAAGAFFSFARFFHFYYLIMLGPPVAALAGIGLRALWQDYREALGSTGRAALWRGWLLPLTLIATAAAQLSFVAPYADQYGWLPPLIAGGCLLAAAVLATARLRLAMLLAPGVLLQAGWRTAAVAMVVGTGALLAAPTAWAAVSVANNNGAAWLPQAGPATSPFGPGGRGGFVGRRGGPPFGAGPAGFRPGAGAQGTRFGPGVAFGRGVGRRGFGGGGFGGGGALTFSGDQPTSLDPQLLRYLQAHQGTTRYLVATATSSYASLFILQTNQPAMALGGYQGWDRIVTPSSLAHLVANGTVRFFYLPAAGMGAGALGAQGAGPTGPFARGLPGQATTVATRLAHTNDDLTTWVQTHCAAVPATAWQTATASAGSASGATVRGAPGGFPGAGGLQLYDCAGTAPK